MRKYHILGRWLNNSTPSFKEGERETKKKELMQDWKKRRRRRDLRTEWRKKIKKNVVTSYKVIHLTSIYEYGTQIGIHVIDTNAIAQLL